MSTNLICCASDQLKRAMRKRAGVNSLLPAQCATKRAIMITWRNTQIGAFKRRCFSYSINLLRLEVSGKH
jgi:hypothetical protein